MLNHRHVARFEQLFFTVLLLASPLVAQRRVSLATRPPGGNASLQFRTLSGQPCPNQGGLLDSISVPVGQPLVLSVYIGVPSDQDEVFNVSSDDPTIANAGDATQGFLGTVTVPQGEIYSDAFTVIGNAIGRANLVIESLSGDYGTSYTPIGPWSVNPASDLVFVDANPSANSCLDPGTSNFSTLPSVLSTCGNPVSGVASDGVTKLLLRTAAGIPGTACYAITSTSSLDQGSIQDAVLGTETAPDSHEYGFTYYTAPQNYGDNSDSRSVDMLFTFTPSQGNGNTTTLPETLTVVRPPVMLLHGLWSGSDAWGSIFNVNDAYHSTFPGDYSATHASNFSTNAPMVPGFVQSALEQFRQLGYAGTQVDVIGHSMGGILTRMYINGGQFQRPNNYNLGDIRRLVTLDTPHKGSSFANLLVSLHQVRPTAIYYGAKVAGDITQGAVCDLAENSPALQSSLSTSTIPARAVTGTGGPVPNYLIGFEQLLTLNVCLLRNPLTNSCLLPAYMFPQNRVDGFRFSSANDAIVGIASQQDGLTSGPSYPVLHFGPTKTVFGFTIISGVTSNPQVASDTQGLLDQPVAVFEGAFPASQSTGAGNPFSVTGLNATSDASDYTAQCATGGPMNPGGSASLETGEPQTTAKPRNAVKNNAIIPDQRVQIVSPSAGQQFSSGQTINITVNVDATVGAGSVLLTLEAIGQITAQSVSATQFQATEQIPTSFTGPLVMTPIAVDSQENFIPGPSVTVSVAPSSGPQTVALAAKYFFLSPSAVPSQQLHLKGFLSDGTQLDLTSSASGTTYQSSNSSVITVSADGLATVAGKGLAIVTAANSGLRDFAIFVVQNPAAPNPPQDLTAEFTLQKSGFRLNRTTGFFVETVVLTNSSGLPIPGPIYAVLSKIPQGVTLIKGSGVTKTFEAGSPYVRVPLSSDGRTVQPGQSVTLILQFLNPGRAQITYSTAIVNSSVAP